MLVYGQIAALEFKRSGHGCEIKRNRMYLLKMERDSSEAERSEPYNIHSMCEL